MAAESPRPGRELSSPASPTSQFGVQLSIDQLMRLVSERASDLMRTQERLRSLLQANRSIVSELSLPGVLTRIVEAARDVADARFAALGVIGPDGTLEQFITVGMDDDTVHAIGELPKGRGLLGALIADPRPIRLQRISDDPRSFGLPPNHPPIESFLGVPIQVPGAVFGNLYLAESRGGSFTEEDEELVLGLAATAGIAIENARHYEESRQRQEWLRARAEVGRNLTTDDPIANLHRIAESVLRLAAADVVSVVVPEPESNLVRVVAAIGTGADDLQGARYLVPGSLAGAAMARGSGVIVDNAEQYVETTICPAYADVLGAVMALPLATEQGMAGAVVVGRARSGRQFTGSDLEMAESFAGQAALAMQLADARANEERLALLQDRDRIARDLHDHVIQRLFAIGLSVQSIAASLSSSEHGARLIDVVGDLDETIREIRTAIFALRENPGAEHSLRSAVMSVVSDVGPALPERPDVIFVGPLDTMVDPGVISDVGAVVREGLTNIARHANAMHAGVRVEATPEELEVYINDDGRGIGDTRRRSGLDNLRRRAEEYGGGLTVTSSPGAGTALSWTIPLEAR
ncbi:GAF domain-containing protein [Microlunatus sp. Gsoil 973]|uniref:sensor histidine kinase n=1 Tax=Microlunatus sp. Gsoil 973 TaxID=2672569 RepID=UPI0012B45FE5|nr:GAF domain-containing protein [Microlunatus sp. Gsoil 973]QGN33352.1 GAF domain-containing protein [Microlunatus sp. Gsoil 973]